MRNFTLVLIITVILQSCENPKFYQYVEVVKEESLFGRVDEKEKEPITLKAISDSAAYIEAYEDFCISLKVNSDMKESIGKVYTTPIKFKLINEEGEDIADNVDFSDKELIENAIRSKIFLLRNTIKESIDKSKKEEISTFKSTAKIDTIRINELRSYFQEKKDEFDPNELKWHKPKSAPKFTNANGIYCYFQSNQGMPSNLRFRIQYYSDDWIFFSKIQFSIDGKAYEYIPSDTETDSGNGGMIWEWFDEPVSVSDKELISALANAKTAKMKFIGRQYYDIKNISSNQLMDIKRTIEYFKAMGGKY